MNSKAIVAFAFLSSTYAYAALPCDRIQCLPDRPEVVGVEGKRLIPPGYLYASEQSIEMKNIAGGGVGGGGSASQDEVNESGAKKAEKAKAEESQGDTFFKSAFRGLMRMMSVLTSWSVSATGKGELTEKPNGDIVTKFEGCLEIAKGSANKANCTKIDAVKRADRRYYIEIKKLVAVQDLNKQWRLVYSTNDTISFLVDDPQEAINKFYAIDPTL